jgi:hypothetical protein
MTILGANVQVKVSAFDIILTQQTQQPAIICFGTSVSYPVVVGDNL